MVISLSYGIIVLLSVKYAGKVLDSMMDEILGSRSAKINRMANRVGGGIRMHPV